MFRCAVKVQWYLWYGIYGIYILNNDHLYAHQLKVMSFINAPPMLGPARRENSHEGQLY